MCPKSYWHKKRLFHGRCHHWFKLQDLLTAFSHSTKYINSYIDIYEMTWEISHVLCCDMIFSSNELCFLSLSLGEGLEHTHWDGYNTPVAVSLVVVLSISIWEVVTLSPTRGGSIKPKIFKIGSDCSFAKSMVFRSENHRSFEYDLKIGGPVSQ
jgi:hypothetical protein